MKVGCNEGGRRSGHTHILGQGGRRQWYWRGGGGRESDDSFVLDMMGQYLYVCYPCKRDERERERGAASTLEEAPSRLTCGNWGVM